MSGKLAIILAAACCLSIAGAAAQPAPTPPPPGSDSMPHHGFHAPHDRAGMMQHFCSERLARTGGRLGYLEAKLDLTDQQRSLWDDWSKDVMSGARAERDSCVARTQHMGEATTMPDRLARLEQALSGKLQNLQTARPHLDALYQSLSPQQKEIFDHPRPAGWQHGRNRQREDDGPNRHFGQR
jgi:hypothetical protein